MSDPTNDDVGPPIVLLQLSDGNYMEVEFRLRSPDGNELAREIADPILDDIIRDFVNSLMPKDGGATDLSC